MSASPASFETVAAWFAKARDTAERQGKRDSAALWSDGLKHLQRFKALADRGDEATVTRAFEIADEAMFELLMSECIATDEHRTMLSLTHEGGEEVKHIAEASQAIQQAIEWLQPRGYVELVEGHADGDFVLVLQEPWE